MSATLSQQKQKKTVVGVIGAGPSGMAVINAFHKEYVALSQMDGNRDKSQEELLELLPFELIVFEKPEVNGITVVGPARMSTGNSQHSAVTPVQSKKKRKKLQKQIMATRPCSHTNLD